MKIAIIGAGYTGLSAAKKLLESGQDVTIYEKQDFVGGMTKTIQLGESKIEKHYRHIFKSDNYVIELLKEFNVIDKLKWPETHMGYYINNKIYAFGTPYTLLNFKPFTMKEKILFGISIIKIKTIRDYKKLEEITAEDWLIKNCGQNIYKKVWEPLLLTKFGSKKNKVAMSWLWGKINLRSSSSTLKGEKLGYLDGSFQELTNRFEDYLTKKNCTIKLEQPVIKIEKNAKKWVVITKTEKEEYDAVISTLAYPITEEIFNNYLSNETKKMLSNVKYTAARTLFLVSKEKFSNFYWINIGKDSIPFGGIIEHTNMIDKSIYDNKNIIYISNYMYKDDKLYNLNAQELLKEYEPYLKQINPEFKMENIEYKEIFEEEYAQPIIENNYSKNLLNFKISDGLYIATMPQIYPEDRGMNYAIRLGYNVADNVLKGGENK